MSESASLFSIFAHGIAAGATLIVSLSIWRSTLGLHMRTAAILYAVSVVAWLVTESPELGGALGDIRILAAFASTSAAFFWLFILAIFADLRVTPLTLLPAAALVVTGIAQGLSQGVAFDVLWAGRNLFGALLALHAASVIVRGWRDDLVEGRRRFRAGLLVAGCAYVLINIGAGFANRVDPDGPWLLWVVGRPLGGLMLALLTLAFALMALQPRAAVFGAARRSEAVADGRAEAADRLLLQRLNGLMAAEAWRREGLTIGQLANDLDIPEHRLRRLINQGLGHRNFADFVNGYRIEAAKRRLADPAQARTTVAAIAYDLGFGSLGPFNRAFRAETGSSPTEWRREALAEASPDLKEAV